MNSARKIRGHVLLASITAATLLGACQDEKPRPPEPTKLAAPEAKKSLEIAPDRLVMFAPLPATMASAANPITDAKVELGRTLYHEARLSKNQDVSCNTCHDLAAYGADGKEVSSGHKAQKGTRNSPTVYNTAGHFAQLWDGHAETVEEEAKGQMTGPVEMASDEKRIVATLKSMPAYVEAFKKAFPDDKEAITLDNTARAIGAFERKLTTPSRWDDYLKGNKAAITDAEKAGFSAFMDAGCSSCHTGPYLGGAIFQKAGLVKPWPNQKDLGRYAITKKDEDRMLFKVPGLRNVAKTAPYFHDGSGKTLEESVKAMASLQSGKELKDDEVKSIVTFLGALTGEIPKDFVKQPELPKATATTPKPDPK